MCFLMPQDNLRKTDICNWALFDVRERHCFDDVGQHGIAATAPCDAPHVLDPFDRDRRIFCNASFSRFSEIRRGSSKRTLGSERRSPRANSIPFVGRDDLRHVRRASKFANECEYARCHAAPLPALLDVAYWAGTVGPLLIPKPVGRLSGRSHRSMTPERRLLGGKQAYLVYRRLERGVGASPFNQLQQRSPENTEVAVSH